MIDIEKLAREAGFEVHPRKHQIRVGADALLGLDSTTKVRKFAALVLEEAAKKLDSRVMGDNNREDQEAKRCADEVRTLSRQITEGKQNCGHCHKCAPITLSNMRMILCETCGNKRCPHANDHRNACTNSNDPGQPGSAYE